MINNKLIEICAGSIEDCATAELFPVDRIELNSAIELGGLTPSVGTLIHAKQVTRLPLCCMVRPRTAGFVYTQHQFESMLFDAELLLENGADGMILYPPALSTPQGDALVEYFKTITEAVDLPEPIPPVSPIICIIVIISLPLYHLFQLVPV